MGVASALGGSVAARRSKCMEMRSRRTKGLVVAGAVFAVALFPGSAAAHGPVAAVASSYLAKVTRAPVGLTPEVIDADQSMWLAVAARETVIVLDYRGAPYLRFSRSGVEVNERSEMYYLNQNPSLPPPGDLTRKTAPKWTTVTAAHTYHWHDGRLQALASVAVPPGTRDVGTWRIPLRLEGRSTAIVGRLLYAPDPSIVWFWPIIVLIACALAAWRVRRPSLDLYVGRGLALAALAAIAVGAVGRGLYGRPAVSVGQLLFMAVLLAFVAFQALWVASGRAGYFSLLLVSIAALYADLVQFPVLLHGYVLMVIPPFLARAAVAVSIGATVGLFAFSLRIGDRTPDDPHPQRRGTEAEVSGDSARGAWA
jgi:hypothetical protein